MEGVLSIVVWISIFLLQVGADIPIQADFDIKKIAGKWYPIAFFSDNAETVPSQPLHKVVVPLENGDLLVKNTLLDERKCEIQDVTFHHTDQPGKFLSPDKTSTIRMIDVDYDSYCVLHVEMQNAAALHVYARARTEKDHAEKKLKQVANSMGFKIKRIDFRTDGASCPEENQGKSEHS